MESAVLLDATPLGRDHAVRGIGAAVRGMVDGLSRLGAPERPALLVTGDTPFAPTGMQAFPVRWPAWRVRNTPDPWPALTVERHVRRLGARLFHATQPDLLPSAIPTVVTCYDLIPAAYPHLFLAGVTHAAQAAAYRRWLNRLADARLVLCISHETAADVVALAKVDPGRVRVVPLACPPAHAPTGEIPTSPYVLMSGGLEPHKNPWVVLDALTLLPAPLHLVMTGPWGGRRVRKVREYAQRLGVLDRVDMLGLVDAGHLAALRKNAVAVVVPSLKEGFGLPVLEAMTAGVPVVASDTPALREVGGDAVRYESPFHPPGWADAISEAWHEPDIRRAAEYGGPSRALTFSWDRTARLIADAHADALAG